MPLNVIFFYSFFVILCLSLLYFLPYLYGKTKSLQLQISRLEIQSSNRHHGIIDKIVELNRSSSESFAVKGRIDEKINVITKAQINALNALNEKIEETRDSLTNFAQAIASNIEEITSDRTEHPKTQAPILSKMPYNEEMQIDN